ncbi:MAG: 16S rRNA (guanine527-N7)-methyltransferase [Gammaproteobacteria bacterium]|jgi:16S rRNA (guanine527-N7)-methyltransferase
MELEQGAKSLGIDLSSHQVDLLNAYLALLQKWNKAYNLTAVRNPAEMVPLHLLDSLAVARFVRGSSIIDVGTGAGLPGIPLSILFPQVQFVLLDSNVKKTRFCQQAAIELKLDNVTVVHGRVEAFKSESLGFDGGFDVVFSRAFAPLERLISLTQHLCAADGRIMAMKSSRAPEELTLLPKTWALAAQHDFSVPGVDAPRCVLELTRL